MRRCSSLYLQSPRLLLPLLLVTCSAAAQTASSISAPPTIPHVIKFSGEITNADGTPRVGVVGVRFSLYGDSKSTVPLWQEVQNVTTSDQGRYTVLLGSTTADGLPVDVFSSNEAHWLGVQVEQQPEQPRTVLVAVPYALKAGDAETLGGKPAAVFVTSDQLASSASVATQPRVQTSVINGGVLAANITGSGSQNVIPKFDSSGTNLINSLVFDDGTHIGVGTQSPQFQFDAQNNDASAAGANMFRIQTPSMNGATMHFISTAANGRHFGFGSNFILGQGEFGIYDYTSAAARLWIDAAGTVGVGTFGGQGNFTRPTFTLDVQNTDSSVVGQHIFQLKTPSVNGTVMRMVSTAANGRDWGVGTNFIVGNGEFGVYDYTAAAGRFMIDKNGNIGIGTTAPSATLDVAGNLKIRSGGITFPDNTVQTTAPTASGTITSVTAGSGLMGGGSSGSVTLSVDSTVARTNAASTSFGGVVTAFNRVNGYQTDFGGTNVGVVGEIFPTATNASTPGTDVGVAGYQGYNSDGSVNANATGGIAVLGQNGAVGGTGMLGVAGLGGVAGEFDNTSGGKILSGQNNGAEVFSVHGTNGVAINSSNGSVPGLTINRANVSSGSSDVDLLITKNVSGTGAGLRIEENGSFGAATLRLHAASSDGLNDWSIAAQDNGSNNTIGLRINGVGGIPLQITPLSSGNFTTVITGNASVSGTFSKGAGSFKIDDPLDPANKYLYHSFVESPDMKNVYDGLVVLDKRGEAWVQLPEYFEALNKDFRYQLTCIGRFAPVYIAKKISGNRFRIAGGWRGLEVSWQVTGIRHDAYANAHRIPEEEEKPAAERGSYLHPELFQQPHSRAAEAAQGQQE
jgi:hypothetical protein